MNLTVTRELLANVAAAVSILTVLFAGPLLFGAYVVVQRSGALLHFFWFGLILALLAGATLAGLVGLLLLG